MKEKSLLSFTIFLLLFCFISGVFFPSQNSYSYVNQVENLGEERSLLELVLKNNRLEFKNKIDNYIFQSSVRNLSLEIMAEFSWSMQGVLPIDPQFFNTEVFYGYDGELFPKNKDCSSIIEKNSYILDKKFKDKLIFIIVPLKQEIETNKLHDLQKNNLCKKNLMNFETFIEVNGNSYILNIYDLFFGNDTFYEFGDTHWNSLGFNTVLKEVLSITNSNEVFNIEDDGTYRENNNVLERLGLIKTESYIKKYTINPVAKQKQNILIIRDSFFENDYSPVKEIEKFFTVTYLKWGEFESINIGDLYEDFDYIIIESSIDVFFSDRISKINN